MNKEALIPVVGVVTDVRTETPDVKTFRVVGLDGKKLFEHIPGQCAMLSIPGVGEAMFSITSSPTQTEYQEFSIKRCGCLTTWLHQIEPEQQVLVRGPYGNGFLRPFVRSSTTAARTATTTAISISSTAQDRRKTLCLSTRSRVNGCTSAT